MHSIIGLLCDSLKSCAHGRQLMLKDWRTIWVISLGMENIWCASERHLGAMCAGKTLPTCSHCIELGL